MDKTLIKQTKGRVRKEDNPLHYKVSISVMFHLSVKYTTIRKGLKLADDTLSVLLVLMDSYVNRNKGLTRAEIYNAIGYTSQSGYFVMRERLTRMLDDGYIEVIGKRSYYNVYIPTLMIRERFKSVLMCDD